MTEPMTIELSDGAWVRLWHRAHALTGRIKGLRPVADGGVPALVMDLGSYGVRAARRLDGSAWGDDVEEVPVPVTMWPVDDVASVPAPTDLPAWQVEQWRLRTALDEEGL